MDTIAQAGHDVLVFSLEMSRYELMSKSISRLSFLEDRKINNSTKHARTTRGIMQGSLYKDYSQQTMDIIDRAEMAYMEYSSHIYITEGIGDIGVDKIREKVKRHIRLTGNRPVVLIDYVQILSPYDVRASDKQNTDKAVLELKRMSRDENIPVIGISSFNRENYKEPVSMASFKESGAIEYGTDVLIGLQYLGMDYQQETEKARAERIRNLAKENNSKAKAGENIKIQVKLLKGRNGGRGEAVLDFYPKFNCFESEGAGEPIRGQEVEAGDLNELFS
jgi:replicative DNA helicase